MQYFRIFIKSLSLKSFLLLCSFVEAVRRLINLVYILSGSSYSILQSGIDHCISKFSNTSSDIMSTLYIFSKYVLTIDLKELN